MTTDEVRMMTIAFRNRLEGVLYCGEDKTLRTDLWAEDLFDRDVVRLDVADQSCLGDQHTKNEYHDCQWTGKS